MRTAKITQFLVCFFMLFSLAACSDAEKEQAEQTSEEMADKTKAAMDDAKEAGEDMADEAEDAMSDAKDAGEEWADDAKDKADEMGDAMQEKGEEIKQKSKDMYEDGKRAISDKAGELATFGACYEKAGCDADDKTASSVTKSQCDASGGKSWYNSDSGDCENL